MCGGGGERDFSFAKKTPPMKKKKQEKTINKEMGKSRVAFDYLPLLLLLIFPPSCLRNLSAVYLCFFSFSPPFRNQFICGKMRASVAARSVTDLPNLKNHH